MGRGRAKAIQKKIARDLKYSSYGTDLDRLKAELASETDPLAAPADLDDEVDDEADDSDDD